MKKHLVLILILMGLIVSPVFSEEIGGEQGWTLDQCIEIALRNRPELEISRMEIVHAEHQIKEAQSYYYPRLNLTAGYTHFSDPLTFEENVDVSAITKPANDFLGQFGIQLPLVIPQEFSVGKTDWAAVILDFNQPIYTFGRIDEGVRQARIGHSIALQQKEKKRGEIIAEVKKGYYQLFFSRKLLALLREADARANVVAKMVKIAYETSVPEKEEKATTRLDYLKARNFLSELKAKLSEVTKNSRLAELGLRMAMGLSPTTPLNVREVAPESFLAGRDAPERIRERILERNIDLKNMELGLQFLDSRRKVATKEYLPKFGIMGQYIGPEDRWGTKNFWYAGIGITMPIFDGFLTKAKIGQAEAQLRKVKNQKTILESALYLQAEHLHATLTELQERIDILQEAIQEAKERMDLASDGYAAGLTDYDELLLSQKAEVEVKANYLQCLLLHQMVKIEIELISGSR